MIPNHATSERGAAFGTHPGAEHGAHLTTFANEPIFCSLLPEGGLHHAAKPMINNASTLSLNTANDTVATVMTTIGITGIVAGAWPSNRLPPTIVARLAT